MDRRIGVEPVDRGQQIALARLGGKAQQLAVHPRGSTRILLVADVDLTGRVIAHEHNRQTGHDPAFVPEPGNIASQLFADLLGQGFPIEERRGHCGFPENGSAGGIHEPRETPLCQESAGVASGLR